jgi:hypothetical protein
MRYNFRCLGGCYCLQRLPHTQSNSSPLDMPAGEAVFYFLPLQLSPSWSPLAVALPWLALVRAGFVGVGLGDRYSSNSPLGKLTQL